MLRRTLRNRLQDPVNLRRRPLRNGPRPTLLHPPRPRARLHHRAPRKPARIQPLELAPEEDQGFLIGLVKAPQFANRDYMEQATHRLYDEVKTVPEVLHVFLVNGYSNT